MKVKLLSCVQLLATPWTADYQAPPSMGFSRQEYWSGLPLPFPYKNSYSQLEQWIPVRFCNKITFILALALSKFNPIFITTQLTSVLLLNIHQPCMYHQITGVFEMPSKGNSQFGAFSGQKSSVMDVGHAFIFQLV